MYSWEEGLLIPKSRAERRATCASKVRSSSSSSRRQTLEKGSWVPERQRLVFIISPITLFAMRYATGGKKWNIAKSGTFSERDGLAAGEKITRDADDDSE
jgi:hypothetical protein